jgi:hypothetical protein
MYIQSVYAWWFDMITSRSGRFMRVILPWSSRSTRSARSGGVSVVRTSEVGPKRTVSAGDTSRLHGRVARWDKGLGADAQVRGSLT